MCDRAGDLDAQKAGDAVEEAADAGDGRAPDEHARVPVAPGARPHVEGGERLAAEDDEGEDEGGGAEVGPVGEVDGGIVAVGERGLDEHGVDCDEERGEDAVEEGEQAWCVVRCI